MKPFLLQLSKRYRVLISRLLRVEDGYDPLDADYVSSYAAKEWNQYETVERTVQSIERRLGRSLAGLRVMDLGADPGLRSKTGFFASGRSCGPH